MHPGSFYQYRMRRALRQHRCCGVFCKNYCHPSNTAHAPTPLLLTCSHPLLGPCPRIPFPGQETLGETHYGCIVTEYENRNTTHATVLFSIGCINFYKERRAGDKVSETGHGPYPSRGNTSQILKPFTGSTNFLLCWYHRKQEWFHCLGGIIYSLQAVL